MIFRLRHLLLLSLCYLALLLALRRRDGDGEDAGSHCCLWHPTLVSIAASKTLRYEWMRPPIKLESAVTRDCRRRLLRQLGGYGETATARQLRQANECFAVRSRHSRKLRQLVLMLSRMFESRGLSLVWDGGCLLGSLRHFDSVPWDDDFDALLPAEQKPESLRLLRSLTDGSGGRMLLVEEENVWRLHLLCVDSNVTNCGGIVDFSFFRRHPNNTVTFDLGLYPKYLPASQIFPLRLRPFGRGLIWTPNLASPLLVHFYGQKYMKECVEHECFHLPGLCGPSCSGRPAVPCGMLHNRYPMTVRVTTPNGTMELLINIIESTIIRIFYSPGYFHEQDIGF